MIDDPCTEICGVTPQEAFLVVESLRSKTPIPGSYFNSHVFFDRFPFTNQDVVVKKVTNSLQAKNELRAFSKLQENPHKHIVKIVGYFVVANITYFLLPKLEPLPNDQAFLSQHQESLRSALCHLRSIEIRQNDLRLSNILFDPTSQELKLIDFGNAQFRSNFKNPKYFDLWSERDQNELQDILTCG